MSEIKTTPNSGGFLTEMFKTGPAGGIGKPTDKKDGTKVGAEDSFLKQIEKADAKAALKNVADKKEIEKSAKPILKFSNHALDRMSSRGIHFTPDQITKIEQGMQKASAKGAKETLVLTDDSALIVSLKDSTVVTVMDKAMMKENVFTKIDSTVFV